VWKKEAYDFPLLSKNSKEKVGDLFKNNKVPTLIPIQGHKILRRCIAYQFMCASYHHTKQYPLYWDKRGKGTEEKQKLLNFDSLSTNSLKKLRDDVFLSVKTFEEDEDIENYYKSLEADEDNVSEEEEKKDMKSFNEEEEDYFSPNFFE
jgi:hypothetical protein